MDINDLIEVYGRKRKSYGNETFKHISDILAEAKEQHRIDFLESDTAKRARAEGREPDHEQSWRAFKGKNFEKLILYMIEDGVRALGLGITTDAKLETRNLPIELSRVRRNLVVHYGRYDIMPDTDLVIYDPEDHTVLAVISCKVTLRERIAQTAYWKLKLENDPVTAHIRSFFVTPDEDGTLLYHLPQDGDTRGFKGRTIVEYDTDGAYVLRDIEESVKVKSFSEFIPDLARILDEKRNKASKA